MSVLVDQTQTAEAGRILVIENRPRLRSKLKRQFEDANYEVRTSEDGLEALEEIRRDPPDLILLDVTMPGLNGFDICMRLKSDPLTSRILVFFLTAKSALDDRLRALEVFADDYITKPWEQMELLLRVRNRIRTRRAQLQSNE